MEDVGSSWEMEPCHESLHWCWGFLADDDRLELEISNTAIGTAHELLPGLELEPALGLPELELGKFLLITCLGAFVSELPEQG